jgi:hypothetical protein
MGDRRRRAFTPGLERVESRELLSGLIAALGGRPPVPQLTAAFLHAHAAAGTGAQATSTFPPISIGVSRPPLLGQGQPTPQEVARERFSAFFSGPTYVGPGRFSDQAKIVFFRGVGGSNSFLHGDYSMAIAIPTDPNAPFSGEAVLEDKNNNSSGIIGLQLTGNRQDVDRLGRPTHLTFISDPNIYSGIFFVSASSGTVDIQYSKNSATATFHGLVYTNGLTSPLRNSDLVARGGRITPRSGRP